MRRRAELTRETGETNVAVTLDIDGIGQAEVKTGLGFLDHMISSLARHARFDLGLTATGDTTVDDHHTVEDCAIVLGRALEQCLGDRSGINRFGYAYAPLDETLCRAVVDLSGRGWPVVDLRFQRPQIGAVATENLVHFLRTFAIEGRLNLHVDLIRGENDHHVAEAAFKALALALRAAVALTDDEVASTKGVLG